MHELDDTTGNTYIEDMLLNLENTISHLFRPWTSSSKDVDLSMDFRSRYCVKAVRLTVLLFGEHFTNCILFDHEITASTVKETTEYILNLIETNPSLTRPHPEPTDTSIPVLHSTLHFPVFASSSSLTSMSPHPLDTPELKKEEDDILSETVRQALYLLQQTTHDTVRSLLVISRCQLDINTTCFQSLLLLLLQRDVSLWCIPLLDTSSWSCFQTNDSAEMNMLCILTGGECLTETVCDDYVNNP